MTHARRALVAGELPPSPEHGTQEAKMYQPDLENKAVNPATDTKEADSEPSAPDAAEPTPTIAHKAGEVPFASDEAGELAYRHGLPAARFWGKTPSGKGGFTVPDIRAILAEG